jgi:signal transduction histidine kinase
MTVYEDADTLHLHRFVRYDAVVALISLAGVLAIHAFLVPSRWMLALLGALAAGCITLLFALRAAAGQRIQAAITLVTATNWAVTLVVTALAPISLYITPLVVVAPVVLAVPFVDHRRFVSLAAGAVTVSLGLVVVGRFMLHRSPIEDQAPRWLIGGVVIVFVPIVVGMLALEAWDNHLRVSRQAADLQASRARVVNAADRARRTLERDLHDSVQQRLVAIAVRLRVVQTLIANDPLRADAQLAELVSEAQAATADLREVTRGIYPPDLGTYGLEHAVSVAALRVPRRTTVKATGLDRYAADVEASVYFSCLEAMQNAVKHAGEDAHITVVLRGRDTITFEVRDDGRGFDLTTITRHGLDNIADRVGAHGGTVVVTSAPGRGTSVRGTIPHAERAVPGDELNRPQPRSAACDVAIGVPTTVLPR